MIDSSFIRDANFEPITTHGLTTTKTIAFTGAAGLGATGTITLFTITGDVAINVFAICTEDLATVNGTVEVGTATSTASLCSQQTATAIDLNEVWHDSVLAVGGQVAGHFHVVRENVILTIATAAVTDGTLKFYATWTPLSADGNVVAA